MREAGKQAMMPRQAKMTMEKRLRRLKRRHGVIFGEASRSVREKHVKKYVFTPSGREVWVVVGRERDYLVLPEVSYCACDDFFYRVLDEEKKLCYHILAVEIARLTRRYERLEEKDDLYMKFIEEWRS